MNPDRWKSLDDLFHLALECDAESRSAFVLQATAGDNDLRRELEAMLAHHDQAHSFIELPAYAVVGETIIEDDSPEQLIGATLGPYRVLSVLGKGGMGVVYEALDQELRRKVALKFLRPDLTGDRSRVLRFKQEARAASALNHPNILTVFAIGEINDQHYIATELVEGNTLRELIKSESMNLSQIISIASQTASALAAAHAAGIMHRDIKPENIVVRPDGYVKVLDFGLAKLIEPSVTDSELSTFVNTEQGTIIGTIQYMSPEQARGLPVDERTDLWSLGVVLYEMLSGHPPFKGKTKSDVMAAILEREPPALEKMSGAISEAIQTVVTKAITKDCQERYQTAEDLFTDLRQLDQSKTDPDLSWPLMPHVNRHLVAETAKQRSRPTDDPGALRASSAKYLVSEIKQHKAGVVLVLTLLAFAVTGISWGIYKFIGSKNSTERFETLSLTRLTSGSSRAAAISPDGKYVAFVKQDGEQRSIWLRQIGTTRDIQISSITDAGWLVFSPDSAFLYYRNFYGDIKRMPLLGGASSLVIKDVGSSISFSPDGKRFAFLRGDHPAPGESSLLAANADGTGEQRLASLRQPDSFERAVAWSPDGTVIACAVTRSDAQATYMSVVQVNVDSGRPEPITTQRWPEVSDLAWLADGRNLLLTASNEGLLFLQIWQLSYTSGLARKITNDFSNYKGVSLTADSKMIVTTQESMAANIWLAQARETTPPKQITNRVNSYFRLSWTPAGDLVYASDQSGSWDIWIRNPADSNEKQLTVNKSGNLLPSVSPDGRYVFFTSIRTDNWNIWRMDIDGGNPKQITNGNLDHSSSCSPDGKWLVYVHDASASGLSTLWKVSTDGGTPIQLTDRESADPVFSPDGTLIACSYGNGKVAIIRSEGGEPLKIFDIPTPFLIDPGFQWTSDGRAVAFVDTREGVDNIWTQPIDGGPRQQITKFSTEEIFSFAWSRDGKQIALARGVETGDVVLLTGVQQGR